MAVEQQIRHTVLENTAVPYKSYLDITSNEPNLVTGSQNTLTSSRQVMERRPGFADAMETSPTAFTSVGREFRWYKWGGTTYISVLSEISGGVAKVYKYVIGSDTSYVLLFTSSGSAHFSFVVSNNTLFMSNGTDRRAWDGSSGTTRLWGIDRPATVATIGLGTGPSAIAPTAAAGTNWTTPNNALAGDSSYATYTATTQDWLALTGFNMVAYLPAAGATILGVTVAVTGNGSDATAANRQIKIALTKDGVTPVGTPKTAVTLNQTTDSTVTQGGASDLWGTTLTYNELVASTFGVLIADNDTTSAGTISINAVTVTVQISGIYGMSGYYYRYTYYNSSTGHESSASDLSACTGVFSSPSTGQTVSIAVTASSDSQVDKVRIYRTTDGGSTDPTLMQEIAGSPFANATATYYDVTADTSLGLRVAPTTTSNDRPPSGLVNLASYAGRIWGSVNATVYFSSLEEITNGVNEEAWNTSAGGNFYPFDLEVSSVRPMQSGVACWTRNKIYGIVGDRRDNFTRMTLVERRGAANHNATVSFGGDVAWLDVANQVWVSSMGEVGFDIRTDLAGIDHSQAYLTVHVSGSRHWLCLLDGANAKLYVMDLDTQVWQAPWVIQGATTCSALSSGETASGNVALSLAYNKSKIVKLNSSSYNDNGNTYQAIAKFNLLHTHPDGSPDAMGYVDHVNVETDTHTASDVGLLVDEDPTSGTHTSIAAGVTDPFRRGQGASLLKKWYSVGDTMEAAGKSHAGERASVKLTWNAAESNFLLYTMDIAWGVSGA